MRIDRQTHKIEEKNRYTGKPRRYQILIALSLRKSDFHITRLKHKDYGNSKEWSTYSISREGMIYEHCEPRFRTDYIGVPQIDKAALSIVLENMGGLIKTPEDDYVNWLNEKCDPKQVRERKWLGQKYWEDFTPKQIESTVLLCRKLCEDFEIPLRAIEFHYPHSKILTYSGIVLKSNYFEDSGSINPFFDLIEFNDLLQLKD